MQHYKDFQFHPKQLNYGSLAKYFEDLPVDSYIYDGTRRRRLSTLEYMPIRGIVEHPKGVLYQNRKDVKNRDTEGIPRRYEPLSKELLQKPAFNQLCSNFFNSAAAFVDGMFDVHQIRIEAKPGQVAQVAPEGKHRDGVKYLGMMVVGRRNCKGGVAELYKEDSAAPVIQKPMIPGLWMIFSDAEFQHYGTQIEPVLEYLGPSTLDFFVFTTPSLVRYG